MENSQNAIVSASGEQSVCIAQPAMLTLSFTGSGREYFKIWLTNLCLSLLTLGLYTPWAKCRRMQYLARHTWLDGQHFDFRANPWRILLGRLTILATLFLLSWKDFFSKAVVTGLLLTLLLLCPLLLRSALRFRLQNTYYRGIPLRFTGTVPGALLSYLPLSCYLFAVPLFVLYGFKLEIMGVVQLGLALLLWPMVLISIKRYQHHHVSYASIHTRFSASMLPVYGYYLLTIVIAITQLAGLGLTVLFFYGVLGKGSQAFIGEWLGTGQWQKITISGLALIFVWLAYLFVMPVWRARMWNHIWSHTEINGQFCQPNYRTKQVFQLMLKNSLLTLVSLGFYRPYAIIAWQKFRLSHMALPAIAWTELRAQTEQQRQAQDGLADGLNLDFSW